MRTARRGRPAALTAGLLGLTLAVSACGTGGGGGGGGGGNQAGGQVQPGCEDFADYAGNSGTVSIYSSIRDIEADRYVNAFADFERCSGIDVTWEGTGEFEAQLNVLVQGGNAPDLATIPQPGLLQRFAQAGQVIEPPESVVNNAEEFYPEELREYGTVDGTFYAAPLSTNVKSFVWYSPKMFTQRGYQVPETWDDMLALSDRMVADGIKPWCAGVESGDATGWPATDWLEDVMLREAGVETYDRWVNHEIPFNAPEVVSALDRAGGILKSENYVNAGFGGVNSIVTVPFQEGGLPILQGQCGLHKQASFYSNNWPEGTVVAEDGDVYAFYLPTLEAGDERPVLGGAEFVTAFSDRPEVQAVQTYMSSPDYNNRRAKEGSFISSNSGLEPANVEDPINRLSLEILRDPEAVFRFDGSDLMPAAVGSGSLWRAMVDWLNGSPTQQVLTGVEQAWPAS